jgi:hypothetical protein
MRLAEHGMALIERLTAPLAADPAADPVPIARRFVRFARAVRWAIVLAAYLRGEFRLPEARPRQTSRAPSDAAPIPAHRRTTARPAAPRTSDSAMHHALRTQTIAQIVTTICRDLGLAPTDPDFPTDLLAITQTPAEFLQSAKPTPAPKPAPPQTQRPPTREKPRARPTPRPP